MRFSVNAVFVSAGSARIIAEADRDGDLHFANLPALRPYSIFALAAGSIRLNRFVAHFAQNTGDINLLHRQRSSLQIQFVI